MNLIFNRLSDFYFKYLNFEYNDDICEAIQATQVH